MLGTGVLKRHSRAAIANSRRSQLVKALHNAAVFFESAYANEGSDFATNGEHALLEKLRPANLRVAFDIGANFGDWCLECADLWRNCSVQAFEVAPPTFRTLEERWRESPHSNRITLNNVGLSDVDATREMFYFPDHPELTCDMHRHDTYRKVPFQATLATGDAWCDARGIGDLDFLKIDVEGAEFRVINGFSQRIAAGKVQCIQFEYGPFSIQTRFLLKDYYAMLSQHYWIGKIFPNHVEFSDYHWQDETLRFSNYCCVLRTRPDLRDLLS